MAARDGRSSSSLLRKARRYVQRRWNTKEYVVIFKTPTCPESPASEGDQGHLFRMATPEDIPWMARHLGVWATWCQGGGPVSSAEPMLREQMEGKDITVIGVENRDDGALVFITYLSLDDFSLQLLGSAFTPGSDVSIRRSWVPPEHRRKGFAARGEIFAEAEAARRGLKGIWGYVQADNTASLAMHRKLGYEHRGRACIRTRLKRRYAGIRLDPTADWRMERIAYSISYL